ncbi:MAG TPA: GNAT family N-acetyltransferase [Gemmataceae bacterium]|jgi:GNAT superfamily N-acetyltransferase|nr:GNAT family N-acetyltransferase [Gemmataceae bacterium]
MLISVTVTHLEMRSPADLRAKACPRPDTVMARVPVPMPELNRFFYSAVGGDWYWIDRLKWTYGDWLKYLDRPELETWIINVAGVPAGYFELERQPGENVEIVYFGLLPAYTGNGLGGWALSEATKRGWAMGAKRVWVHTCDLDHPGALANYIARGFRTFKVEMNEEELPAQSIGPWPNANKPRSG